ncbi:hypothetical protein A0H81_02185 [Grifola frondosa]|uniref:Uncharacterized protein n=1 Tax=Grifola frondosa TaxID=5627 RepID=A0A1C7MND8_GRIFR|nr:hypothetical protein A0H81_02185 [Grifola frondosa]
MCIDRMLCRENFLAITSNYPDLHAFSVNFFNSFGWLKPEFTDNEYHKGTGVWGCELDEGMIVYVLSIKVIPAFRCTGIGSHMLKTLMECRETLDASFFFCRPQATEKLSNKGERENVVAHLITTLRKFNFHVYPLLPTPMGMITTFQDGKGPLFFKASSTQRASCAKSSQPPYPTPQFRYPVEWSIISYGSAPPKDFADKDEHGFSTLHIAAAFHNITVVRLLLSLPGEVRNIVRADLHWRGNVDGQTPLEACEYDLRAQRECTCATFGRWDGHPADALRVAFLLRRAAEGYFPDYSPMRSEPTQEEDEYVRAHRLGCSCGACTEGWLAPRMRFRLAAQAAAQDVAMADACSLFDGTQPLSADGVRTVARSVGMEHVPMRLWRSVTEGFHDGYRAVFRAIALVLNSDAGIPDAATVRVDASNAFLKCGGRVEHALACVIDRAVLEAGAWDRSVAGDKTWAALPRCENDLEFGLVRERLGLDPD